MPTNLQGLARFRVKPAPCRCVVPEFFPLQAQDILEALHELQRFVERILYYFEAIVVGSKGENSMKRSIDDAAQVCWDMTTLMTKFTQKKHYEAFFLP